ncbi:hypothetical protein COO60DRAFT_1548608, partial [Scenedesmus sp. NREL 46B-D3]
MWVSMCAPLVWVWAATRWLSTQCETTQAAMNTGRTKNSISAVFTHAVVPFSGWKVQTNSPRVNRDLRIHMQQCMACKTQEQKGREQSLRCMTHAVISLNGRKVQTGS